MAEDYCQEYGAHLLTIETMEENTFVTSTCESKYLCTVYDPCSHNFTLSISILKLKLSQTGLDLNLDLFCFITKELVHSKD